MSVRRSLLLLALLMFITPAAAFTLRARQITAESAADDALRNLQRHTVRRGQVEIVVSALGSLDVDRAVDLSPATPGRVAELFVRAGDPVDAGAPLLRLENDLQRVAYEQALIELERADLTLADLTGPPDETTVQIAQANLDAAWGDYLSLQNAVTQADIEAAELAYAQALAVWEEVRTARDQAVGGFGSPAYNTLNAQEGAASFNAEIARLQLEALTTASQPALGAAYARVQQAEAELERVQAGPPPFEIEAAQIAVQRAQAQIEQAEAEYYRTLLTAPFSGIVSVVNTEVGGLVAPGLTVITLSDIDPLRLTVQVDEIDIRQIDVGQTARIQLDALRDVELSAEITQIAPLGEVVNGIVSYDVDLSLIDSDPRARAGMTAEAIIIIDQRQDVLVVPNTYIRLDRGGERGFVNVLRDGVLIEDVQVTLGLRGLDVSEVNSGLIEGDVVAIDLESGGFSLFGE